MYRNLLDGIGEGREPILLRPDIHRLASLAVIQVTGIERLVNLEAEQIGFVYSKSLCGTASVHPDPYYKMFDEFQEKVRDKDYRGIVYPSARHKEGHCIVLFRDESECIIPEEYLVINIELWLVTEDHDYVKAPSMFDPYCMRVHPTIGFYRFLEHATLETARAAGVLHPGSIPEGAYVDFVRRRYRSYPQSAVMFALD